MRILAADIGGTNARFAAVEISGLSQRSMGRPLVIPTAVDGAGSFRQLLERFRAEAPAGMAEIEAYDGVALGVAGAVYEERASLPNIPWDIDLNDYRPAENTWLLNDFYAQAHAFLDPQVIAGLQTIRGEPGADSNVGQGPGTTAIVGAGTGLGHAALICADGRRVVLGSEAGHETFAFHGAREKEIESFMLSATGQDWLSADDVVSGSGAALIHQCLTGEAASPAAALAEHADNPETRELFARFYARACRNFCLAMFPVSALVISGGVAIKNPQLLKSPAFIDEFNDALYYRPLLERVPIYLNRDEGLGIEGAAIYAWRRLSGQAGQAATGQTLPN